MNFWLGFLIAWAIMSAVILVIEYLSSNGNGLFGVRIEVTTEASCWVFFGLTLPVSFTAMLICTVINLLISDSL